MPVYAYRCADCKHEVDLWRPATDEAGPVCPECGGEMVRRFVVCANIVIPAHMRAQ